LYGDEYSLELVTTTKEVSLVASKCIHSLICGFDASLTISNTHIDASLLCTTLSLKKINLREHDCLYYKTLWLFASL